MSKCCNQGNQIYVNAHGKFHDCSTQGDCGCNDEITTSLKSITEIIKEIVNDEIKTFLLNPENKSIEEIAKQVEEMKNQVQILHDATSNFKDSAYANLLTIQEINKIMLEKMEDGVGVTVTIKDADNKVVAIKNGIVVGVS